MARGAKRHSPSGYGRACDCVQTRMCTNRKVITAEAILGSNASVLAHACASSRSTYRNSVSIDVAV